MYYISKLADGKVWVLDNLRWGGTNTITFANSDANITTSFCTLPALNIYLGMSYTDAYINLTSKKTSLQSATEMVAAK